MGDFRGDPARYTADATAVLAAEAVHFPLAVAVRQPTYEAAVRAARQTVEDLLKLLAGLNAGTVEAVANHLRLLPEPKGAARVELTAALVLRWGTDRVGFWDRADATARALDLLGRQAGAGDVGVTVGPVNHRAELGGK